MGLGDITCSDCETKLGKEYDRLKKDENKEIKEKLQTEEVEKEWKYLEEAKRRGVINCLYNYFKNTPKKLQVVCDWDEVIQPLEPKVYYELSEREGTYYDAPCHSIYTDKSMVKSCLSESNSFALGLRSVKDKIDKIKNEPDFYEYSPFLTLAQELLKLVKENKVEVVFLSAYDKRAFSDGDPRKKKIFSETFGKFPNCSLNLLGFDSEGQSQTKGSLTVITGAMFAGKTSLLIEKYNQLKDFRKCLVFKPSIDKRYDSNNIVSHQGEGIRAISITNIEEIEQYKEQAESIFIDEIHFFKPNVVPYLEELIKQNKEIIVAGLD
ncbi:10361_t:CDS:2 [Ambispora gerdemannii]|uniref:thymidine kinase n=1 Tax=Ambispora gerdemannii TaxID=144530 RepID=A0A9N9HCW5_9GLOM|nr:10361_t:CDS:2 [Ambispora gerdemannii]